MKDKILSRRYFSEWKNVLLWFSEIETNTEIINIEMMPDCSYWVYIIIKI